MKSTNNSAPFEEMRGTYIAKVSLHMNKRKGFF